MGRKDVGADPVRSPEVEVEVELHRLRAMEETLTLEVQSLIDRQSTLEREREDYWELFEQAPLPALTLDRNAKILSVNIETARLLGESPQRLRGRYLWHFVSGRDRSALLQQLRACEVGATVDGVDLEIVGAQEVPVPMQLWLRRTGQEAGTLYATLVDRREQQRAAVENLRLLESERSARAASAAKDEFIAMLSHELRTPLTPVLALSSAMEKNELISDEVKKAFATIRRNVAAEAQLIDDLLDVSGMAHGKLKLRREPLDVHRTVEEAMEIVRGEVTEKSHTLSLELAAGAHHVHGDPLRVRQVIWNLLRNAVRYTPHGGQIRVSSWNNAERLLVEVSDNGIGIEPAVMERLFDPFEQAKTEPSPTGGLGLGLAIAKGIADLHGGSLSGTSPGRGRGSRFVLELETIAAPSLPEPMPRTPAPAAGDAPRRSLNILLVEDHPDSGDVMLDLLAMRGYEVLLVRTMEAALKVDLTPIDLIVSDIGLPDGTGIELIQKLQAHGRRPAIALSGFGMASDVRACEQAGFDLHLTKPVQVDELVDAIRSLQK